MAPINEREDDLVMESTTDSAEQIAEGLGVELAPAPAADDPAPPPPAVPDGTGDDGSVPPAEIKEPDPAPGQVSVEAAKVGSPRKGTRKRAVPADGQAKAEAEALRAENEALKKRLAEAPPAVAPAPAVTSSPGAPPPAAAAAPPVAAVKPADVPATHPELAEITERRTALGAKPKQDDFDDYDEFVEVKDTWLRQSGALDAEESIVRRQAARQVAAQQEQAAKDANTQIQTFQTRREAAKAKHPDFEQVMTAAEQSGVVVYSHIAEAMIQSDAGGELVYHLAKNPAELARIQALPKTAAIMEVGALAKQLTGGAPARSGPPVRVSKAPEPQGTTLGDLPSGGKEQDLDDPNLTQAQYNRLRDRMDVQSGRRQSLH